MQPQSKWYQCSNDSDCVKTSGICGNAEAINKNYIKEFADYIHIASQGVACQPPTPESQAIQLRLIAKCVNGRCTLVDPGKSAAKASLPK